MLDEQFLKIMEAYVKVKPTSGFSEESEMIEIPKSSLNRLLYIVNNGMRDYDPDIPKDWEEMPW